MSAIQLYVWHCGHPAEGRVVAAMATSVKSARQKLLASACPKKLLDEALEREPDSVQAFREAVVWGEGLN